jgi:tetratricopeptide (TPR) repeat protein
MRFLTKNLALGMVLLCGQPTLSAQRGVATVTMRLPGLRIPVGAAGTVKVTQAPSAVGITLDEVSSHIQAGSIRFYVNGATATTFVTTDALAHGFLCRLDLSRPNAPQIALGDNVVRVDFRDTWNQNHTANFHIVYAGSDKELAALDFKEAMIGYLRNGDAKVTLQGLEQAILVSPCYAAAWYNKGILEEQLLAWSKARDAFRQYLACAPAGDKAKDAQAQIDLTTNWKEGDPAPAETNYQNFLRESQTLFSHGQVREAMAEAARAMQTMPQRYEAYVIAAIILHSQHQDAAAKRLGAEALKRAPKEKQAEILASLGETPGR